MDQDRLRFFVHYLPSYYHFHVHIVHAALPTPGAIIGKGKSNALLAALLCISWLCWLLPHHVLSQYVLSQQVSASWGDVHVVDRGCMRPGLTAFLNYCPAAHLLDDIIGDWCREHTCMTRPAWATTAFSLCVAPRKDELDRWSKSHCDTMMLPAENLAAADGDYYQKRTLTYSLVRLLPEWTRLNVWIRNLCLTNQVGSFVRHHRAPRWVRVLRRGAMTHSWSV